ncbi:MAG: hypothetical protein KatS3mg057_0625 [Herpetosiphonaceae bacterium]|nr:MAG: hypothetical protein KatS3mg057_0625 [Herpetosiphonaceae bacterium]
MFGVRRLSIVATILTIVAAFMGSYVRGKNAGLACPDWPLCHGRLIPPLEGLILLEWGHRMLVLFLSLIIVAILVQCWWQRRPERWVATGVFVLLIVQAVLGGITVLIRLDPWVVAIHQGMALVFFGSLVVLTVLTLQSGDRQQQTRFSV